jgi:hypothetical protein
VQELIWLGDEEPGRNFLDVMYNNIEFQVQHVDLCKHKTYACTLALADAHELSVMILSFQVPGGWLKSVPNKGQISLHYCRERDTCRRIREDFIASQGAWPQV